MLFGSKKSDSSKKDWADQATETIENFIDGIRDKAIVPLTTVVRGVVYGLLALLVGFAALILLATLVTRLLNVYLGNLFHLASVVWVSYLAAGAIFVFAGLFLWSKRYSKTSE